MSIKKNGIMLALVAMLLFVASGCYKVATVEVDNSPAITKIVSFSKDIVPILGKSCAVTSCHNSGGHAPDLSAANAYNSLTAGGYIDKTTPANSKVYQWLTGKGAAKMPLGADNNPSNINALMLAWITQSAKNN